MKYAPPTLWKSPFSAPPLTATFAPPPPDDERQPDDEPPFIRPGAVTGGIVRGKDGPR